MLQTNALEGRVLRDQAGREQYRLVRLIGAGGFGHVYEAEDLTAEGGRRVAVKVVRPGLARQIRREAVLGQIRHPSIVKYLDYAVDGELPYVVMELLSGRNLEQIGRLSEQQLFKFVRQVCSALQAAHEQNLVHRDLKPQNVMLVAQGRPEERFVILDFGIASQLDSTASLRGATMDGAGTPEYMSPEQLRGEEPTLHSDLYSVGVMLYQQLTGRLPYSAEGISPPEYYALIQNNAAPTFRETAGDAPLSPAAEALEPVVLACVAREPAARPASAEEIRVRCEEYFRSAGVFTQSPASAGGGTMTPAASGDRGQGTLVRPREEKDRPAIGPAAAQRGEEGAFSAGGTLQPGAAPESAPPRPADETPGGTFQAPSPEAGAGTGPAGPEAGIAEAGPPERAPRRRGRRRDRRQAGFPVVVVSTVLVVLAMVLFSTVLYPFLSRNRLENRLDEALRDGAYAEAAGAVDDVDFLTELWVNEEEWRSRIRETGQGRARDMVGRREWVEAIEECRKLDAALPPPPTEDAGTRPILEKVAGEAQRQVRRHAGRDEYREAVAYLKRERVVHRLREVDPELLPVDSLTSEIRARGLRRIDALRREGESDPTQILQPLRDAVRIGADLQDAFPADEEVRQAATEARIDLHRLSGDRLTAEKRYSRGVEEYGAGLELASRDETKSALLLRRAEAWSGWAADEEASQGDREETLGRFQSAFDDLQAIGDLDDPTHGDDPAATSPIDKLRARTYLKRAEFYLKEAEGYEGEDREEALRRDVRAAIADLQAASTGPLDADGQRQVEEYLRQIAETMTETGDQVLRAGVAVAGGGSGLNAESDAKLQEAIAAFDVALLADEARFENYYPRGFARAHLQRPDFAGAIADFGRFEEGAKERLSAGEGTAEAQAQLRQYLARSQSLHAWILATCPEKPLRNGRKALSLAEEAERNFDALERSLSEQEWLAARSDAFKSKSAAYAELGEFQKAIDAAKRFQADVYPPEAGKSAAEYTFEEQQWVIHERLKEEYYGQGRTVPYRFSQ